MVEMGRKFKGKYMQLGPKESEVLVPFGMLGPSTHPGQNQLMEMNLDANWGTKNIELSFLFPKIIEQTPDYYYDEMRRLAKLSDVKPSLHAPVVNLAGLQPRSGKYLESQRRSEEIRLKSMIDNAYRVGGANTVVNVHASEAVYGKLSYMEEEGKKPEEITEYQGFVDQDTDQFMAIPRTERWHRGKVRMLEPGQAIKEEEKSRINKLIDAWGDTAYRQRIYSGELKQMGTKIKAMGEKYGKDITDKWTGEAGKEQEKALRTHAHFSSLVQNARETEKEIGGEIQRYIKKYHPIIRDKFKGDIKKYVESIRKEYGGVRPYLKQRAEERYSYLKEEDPQEFKRTVREDVKQLEGKFNLFGIAYPEDEVKRIIPVTEYEMEKTAKTLSNAAMHGFSRYGGKAPIVSIENPYPFVAFGRAEDLVKLIKKAREEFANKLKKRENMSSVEARKMAHKLIGANIDIGHLNLLKQYGFKDKKLMEEVKKLMPLVKHVHITDNFGYEDSHLVPGWGNAPIKEMLKELEKKGYKGKMILEAGGAEEMWAQTKGVTPHPFSPSLTYTKTPLYETQPMGERWTEFTDEFSKMYSPEFPTARSPVYEGYNIINYGSFSQIPGVFGSHQPGKDRSKFAGSPMA